MKWLLKAFLASTSCSVNGIQWLVSNSESILLILFSQAVMEAGKALWRYYHEQPEAIADAALYDIRLHFQGINEKGKMNTGSQDEHYNQLMGELRQSLKVLAQKIEPKVYEYGFLKR